MGYRIETADTKDKYEGLRDLWCRVFGDEPGFVDFFYRSFGGDITGYVICNDAGKAISALTCFRCGVFRDAAGKPACDADGGAAIGGADGLPVYVSYAICTDPEYRGQGLAAALTGYVRDVVTAPRGAVLHESDEKLPAAEGLGGISLVSPAEESLIDYYGGLGYRETFLVDEHAVRAGEEELPEEDGWSAGNNWTACAKTGEQSEDGWCAGTEAGEQTSDTGAGEQTSEVENGERSAKEADTRFWGLGPDGNAVFLDEEDGEAFEPELSVESVGGSMYNRNREEFLASIPHVEMSSEMMEFLRADGDGGLLVINDGDAICRVAYAGAAEAASGNDGTADGIDSLQTGDTDGNGGMQIEDAAAGGAETRTEGRNAQSAAAVKTVVLDELLVNPQLKAFSEEIEEEIALRLAEYFGAETLVYRTPGCGRCQSMSAAAGAADTVAARGEEAITAGDAETIAAGAYFGFPVE